MPRVQLVDETTAAAMKGTAGPEARRALMHRPAMANALGLLNDAVAESCLDPRLHELVRYRIALINGCLRCQTYRSPAAIESGLDDTVLTQVHSWRDSPVFRGVERLALDYAERFCGAPDTIGDELVTALRAELGDAGLLDLTVCIAKYLATGRLISVLDLDQSCAIPLLVSGN